MLIKPDLDNDITVGRLGNKLFIIAAMIGHSDKTHDDFILPHWKYEQYFPNLLKHIQKPVIPTDSIIHYKEPYFHYAPLPAIDISKYLEIQGYFQSPKYFEGAEELVRHYFMPSDVIISKVQTYLQSHNLTHKRKCVIQVRRGDYTTNLKGCYNIIPAEWYLKQITTELIQQPDVYMVFSDDIPWCKEQFKGEHFHFVETGFNVLDLFLQATCQDYIIANSSFGWFGAWLNPSVQKQVIMPKEWFGPKLAHNTQDISASGWLVR